MVNGKKNLSKTVKKTSFKEFLEMDMPEADISAKEDLKLERKLAKKLKVRNSKLRGDDDGLNSLFEGISSSVLESREEGDKIPDAEEPEGEIGGRLELGAPDSEKAKAKVRLEDSCQGLVSCADTVTMATRDATALSNRPTYKVSMGRRDGEASDVSLADNMVLDEDPVRAPSHKGRRKKKLLEQGQGDNAVGDAAVGVFSPLKPHDAEVSRKKELKKRAKKTKFEEFLEVDMPRADISAEEDLKLERKLAKKLKVKNGKLRGDDDGLNMLFEGIPSVLDFLEEGEEITDAQELPLKKKCKQTSSNEELEDDLEVGFTDSEKPNGVVSAWEEVHAKAPSLKTQLSGQGQESNVIDDRAVGASNRLEAHGAVETLPKSSTGVVPQVKVHAGNESEEHTQILRQVHGLLMRLSESNVESTTEEMSKIFLSAGRSVGSQIIGEQVLASSARANEQYAALYAALVAGMACSVGIEFSAKLMASLAKSFENEYRKEDRISLTNLTLLLSYLCIFGVCSSELIYDFLIMLGKRLAEIDVKTIRTILERCGMKIRNDDPAAMRDFILSVQNRVSELKESSGDGEDKINRIQMEILLETICDIKNNKQCPKEDTVEHTRIKKWLQKLRVENYLLRGLTWSKLLDPEKKGQWWLSGEMAAKTENMEEVSSTIDKEVLEAQKMLQLAAAQRMNTDARRAIFCIIMSGEDYIDAFEKLLRLDLPATQDREIIRVLVECCLQEKVFNKYYTILASKLCEHNKNHKFTLQFTLWDHFKELESMQLIRSMHLAKFVAEMVASFTLSLAVLKSVDFSEPRLMNPKRIMHFRILFEAIFEFSDKLVWNMFTRIALTPELETLRNGIEFFVKEYVAKTNKNLSNKFKVAKKALNNMEGVLM